MNTLIYFPVVKKFLTVLVATSLVAGVASGDGSDGKTTVAMLKTSKAETGVASYYGVPYHGRQTASGEVFNMNELTAAHPTLKFGTKVKVTHLANNRSVTVRINDRGPFVKGRVIDLSKAAAEELQMVRAGVAEVKIEVLN
ncbi:MAG: septal ring lytic transglycosylase RlpA family protein [Verrucomicrobiota bacterium]